MEGLCLLRDGEICLMWKLCESFYFRVVPWDGRIVFTAGWRDLFWSVSGIGGMQGECKGNAGGMQAECRGNAGEMKGNAGEMRRNARGTMRK